MWEEARLCAPNYCDRRLGLHVARSLLGDRQVAPSRSQASAWERLPYGLCPDRLQAHFASLGRRSLPECIPRLEPGNEADKWGKGHSFKNGLVLQDISAKVLVLRYLVQPLSNHLRCYRHRHSPHVRRLERDLFQKLLHDCMKPPRSYVLSPVIYFFR